MTALTGLLLVMARMRGNHRAAVASAAMAPAVFLLLNRVFSPQFLVLLVAGWAVAGALLARHTREVLTLAALVGGATIANALVYPVQALHQFTFSGVLFLCGMGATLWVIHRGFRESRGADPGEITGSSGPASI